MHNHHYSPCNVHVMTWTCRQQQPMIQHMKSQETYCTNMPIKCTSKHWPFTNVLYDEPQWFLPSCQRAHSHGACSLSTYKTLDMLSSPQLMPNGQTQITVKWLRNAFRTIPKLSIKDCDSESGIFITSTVRGLSLDNNFDSFDVCDGVFLRLCR